MVYEYRPCVVAVFSNGAGQILACERSDISGSWQLPQGGIEPGESALNAIYREMREELGCDRFKILKEASGLITYKFPEDLKSNIAKKWLGQSQVWFLTQFETGFGPDLTLSDGEFVNFAWKSPKQVLEGTIAWKQEAYKQGLLKLGLISS